VNDLIAAAQEADRDESAARREASRLRALLRNRDDEIATLRRSLDLVTDLGHHIPDPPEWLAPEPAGSHHGTPLLILADSHFDEVVAPAEVLGLNSYNRVIAEQRLQRAFEGAITLPQHYLGSKLIKDGIVVAHAGDLITGEIHDELTESNDGVPTETVLHFLDPMIAGLRMLREEYGRVHVVEVDGNHDRLHKKKRAKRAATTAWSFLFWQLVARDFRRHSTVTFQIPEARDTIFPVYDTRFLLHHGDQFRGGSGIAGPVTPMAIGDYRKRRKHAEAARHDPSLAFDVQLFGHFHHRTTLPGMVMAGCLKGYDEYAMGGNFPFDPPSQELLMVTPERGITFQAPIWVADREAEGW